MSTNLFKIKNGIKLDTNAATLDAAGEIKYNGAGNLILRDGSGEKTVLDEDNSVTISNKTISASSNTISDIANSNIAASAAIDATKIADGSVSSTEFQYLGGVTSDIQTQINAKADSSALTDHLNDTVDAHDASAISSVPSGNLAATDVQAALNELQTDVDTRATSTALTDHINDATDAHDASAISSVATGNLAATDVQAALNELQGDIDDLELALPAGDDYVQLQEQGAAPSTPASGYKRLYAKTDGKLYTKDSAGNEIEVGSGAGGGGILYINEDFETGVASLVAYADAAGTSPVDGTGGSPNLTVAEETVTPLIGDKSASISKDAANRQGEGVAILSDTVDEAYEDKVHTIEFLWKTDANYADGDMGLFVVHPTTGTVEALYFRDRLGTVTNQLPKSSDSVLRVVSSFLPIDPTYRIVLHVRSTSATAYEVLVDNIQVGPQKIIPGTIVTAWENCTITGSWVSNTTYTAKRKRIGDTAYYDVFVSLSGAPTATALTLTLDLTIDTNKLASGTNSGNQLSDSQVAIDDTGTTRLVGRMRYSSPTVVFPQFLTDTGGTVSATDITATNPFTFANGDFIHMKFSVPISGWDAGAVLSTTQVDVLGAKVAASNNAGTVLTADVTNIDFSTETEDTHSAFNGTVFTAPATADYVFTGNVRFNAAYSGNVNVFVNGTSRQIAGPGNSDQSVRVDGIIRLNKGDTFSLRPDTNATLSNSGVHIIRIKGLPDFSTFGVYGNVEILNAASSAFNYSTSGYASNEWMQMTGNSVTLSPGTWRLNGRVSPRRGTATGTTFYIARYTLANGDNTTSIPTTIDTILTAGSAQFYMEVFSSNLGEGDFAMPTAYVRVTSPTTVFIVGRLDFSSAGTGSISVGITAERIK